MRISSSFTYLSFRHGTIKPETYSRLNPCRPYADTRITLFLRGSSVALQTNDKSYYLCGLDSGVEASREKRNPDTTYLFDVYLCGT